MCEFSGQEKQSQTLGAGKCGTLVAAAIKCHRTLILRFLMTGASLASTRSLCA
jgi:hypothetical protein